MKEIINLRKYIDDQLYFFIEKFKEIGWKQEDVHYISKKVDFQDRSLGIVFYSELLEYSDKEFGNNYLNMLCPWIVGRIEINNEKEENILPILRSATDFIKEEVKLIGWKMFHDEDAFFGYFSRHNGRGYTRLKFYLNKEYPNGHWENHTL